MVVSGGSRRRGKPRSRILYWFRTPPGVRVGRSALDEEAIKLIEAHNPDVEFDWTRILKGEAPERGPKDRDRPPREREPSAPERPPAEDDDVPATVPIEAPPPIAAAKLGAEGLARLRARHAEILARISEGIPDPARQDELKAQAERLNPDTWVTDAEVAAALESYEAVFESLRTVVGRRRKRRRSRRPRSGQPAAPEPVVGAEEQDPEGQEDEEEI